MPIRFKCRHCKKGLKVPDNQAGRKNICPACRKPIVIPKPRSAAEVDTLAAAMLADGDRKEQEKPKPPAGAPIKFSCEFCTEDVEAPASAAGTKMPCPECRRIIRVPDIKEDKPKDWRDVAKKGPIGARQNQPEELKDAWGTEQARGVTRRALEEADALPVATAEPVNLALWLKRGFWTTMALGFIYLIYSGMSRSRVEQREKLAAEEAVKLSTKLRGDWTAEIHRAAGELYCAKRKPILARQHFRTSLANVQNSQRGGVDIDMFLIDLALAQIELGGVEGSDEVLTKERLPWPEVQREVSQTLERVSPDARGLALRLVGVRFCQKKQSQLAMGIAGVSPAQHVGLTLAHKDYLEQARGDADKEVSEEAKRGLARLEKQADKKLLPPRAGEPLDSQTRIGHVEGLAYQGKYKESLDLACRRDTDPTRNPDEVLDCLEACVGGAELALASNNLPEAARFAQKSAEAFKEAQTQQKTVRDWLLFEMVRAAVLADLAEAQELSKSLPPAFQPYLKFVIYRHNLSKSPTLVMMADDLGRASKEERELLSWPLAWEAMARHNAAHYSSRDNILAMSRFTDDENVRPFLLIGFALGQHDIHSSK